MTYVSSESWSEISSGAILIQYSLRIGSFGWRYPNSFMNYHLLYQSCLEESFDVRHESPWFAFSCAFPLLPAQPGVVSKHQALK
mmetsp:Transcript_22403/g.33390  ORF Transcript_22403/g.33390 Transcript_22403/m.33390 type:complete len:84 (-) Transcript_22403:285-536(-)